MTPYYNHKGILIYNCDCRDILPDIHDIDTIITDPPYGLKFMGKDWDHGIPGVHFWELIRAACKPGAMCLAFGGTRTFHRLMCAIEDVGFQIKDTIMWVHGQGFPKSKNISKAIDEAAGAKREVVGESEYAADRNLGGIFVSDNEGRRVLTAPATNAAKLWDGWGSGLKPAWEPITVAMNPLDGTFANNALKHGVAGFNIDGARVPCGARSSGGLTKHESAFQVGKQSARPVGARFPSNLIHDGSDEVLEVFARAGESKSAVRVSEDVDALGATYSLGRQGITPRGHFDTGTAARFFYAAKASRAERNMGCEGLLEKCGIGNYMAECEWINDPRRRAGGYKAAPHSKQGNFHPCVKPLALMRYLCRLTKTPTGGVILDPFAGSGSMLVAALQEGRPCIGIETSEEFCEIAARRCEADKQEKLTL